MNLSQLAAAIKNGRFDAALVKLYGASSLAAERERYLAAAREFHALYGERDGVRLFSVPGRSEVSGNHTDHQRGRVLAAAVSCDIIAVACAAADNVIRIKSEGFPIDTVPLGGLDPQNCERSSSSAIIAGMAHGIAKEGGKIGGFAAYTTSTVAKGSGLSSSAAFEVTVGNILNHLYNGGAVENAKIARIAQYAENVFFGKPCGLMDQTACAVGGFCYIDFENPDAPTIEKLEFPIESHGYALYILNTGGSHADLGEDYAAIPGEMKRVARHFGREVLRGLSTAELIAAVPKLRGEVGDRAILRALHFIGENERVIDVKNAVKSGDMREFLRQINASGDSSYKLLQNIYTTKNPAEQGVSLAIALARHTLISIGIDEKNFAVRVHGGGFAGTVQIFAPIAAEQQLRRTLDAAFGQDALAVLSVRADGAAEVI